MGLFSVRLALRAVLVLCVMLLAAGCNPQPPPEEDLSIEGSVEGSGGGVGVSGQVDAAKVIEHLKANGLPIDRVDVYNEETDPVDRLGRPGQYVGKAIFHDNRQPLEFQSGEGAVISFQSSGGIVEIFSSATDVEERIRALDLARAQFPAAFPEYQYQNGVVLLRLGHVLTPDEAAQYGDALATFQG